MKTQRLLVLLLSLAPGIALNDADRRDLLMDDENFWSRFIIHTQSSSLTSEPTPLPTLQATTPGPTPLLTPEPTPGPTPEPTPGPTPLPTPEPTPGPTPEPTPGPTPAPTESPSESPTGICSASTTISCLSEDGVECSSLTRPNGQCSRGTMIQTLRFQIDFCACADSLNTQESFFESCEDLGTLPPEGATARVACSGPMGEQLLAQTIQNGDEVTVSSSGALPDTIVCRVFSSSSSTATELQTFTINTSGEIDLFLKDKFGSFVLLACDEQDCIKEVTYAYIVENTGSVDMVVSVFERMRDGETQDLLGGNIPVVPVGQTNSASDSEVIDTCIGDEYVTTSAVVAEPPGGVGCEDQSSYSFEILDNCRVGVEIECKTEDGTDCKDIQPPVGSCTAGASISELEFRYNECTCAESQNNQDASCKDSAPFPPGGVNVICVNANSFDALQVSPSSVKSGDTLVISSTGGSGLPEEVSCTISDGNTVVQEFNFFTQNQALNLDNKFGSFELVSCADESGISLTCEALLSYTYGIVNVGTGVMDLTHLNRTRNDEAVSLFDSIPPDSVNLERGDSVSIEEKELTDICGEQMYTTTVGVDANPESGVVCTDEDTYSFTVTTSPTGAPSRSPTPAPTPEPTPVPTPSPTPEPSPLPTPGPTPVPTLAPSPSPSDTPTQTPSAFPTAEPPCVFELDVECIPPPGVPDCNATPPPVEQCQGRPFEMGFIFNGGDCEGSYNIQTIGDKFICEDRNGGPPATRGEEAYIVVTALRDDTLYFEGWVAVGDPFTLSDGGNDFVADQLITIYSSNDTSNPNNVLQAMQYHSSCSSNLFLKDRFGAVQLVEWVNAVQGRISCFANQTFDLDITVPVDIRGDTATMQSLTIASNVDPFFFNLTDQVFGIIVEAGDTLQVEIAIPIDLTTRKTYNLLISLTALTNSGTICDATELTSFTAGYPLPPIFPTFSPTQAPTVSPQPTIDPARAPCILDADIDCKTASGRSCRRISAPSASVCNDENGATAVEFLLTGNTCGTTANCEQVSGGNIAAPNVFITVVDDGDTVFSSVVNLGEIFRVSGPFNRARLEITISSNVNGQAGQQLQVLSRVDLGCDGSLNEDLTLLTNYGALQLVGFASTAQGSQSILETFTLTFSVGNNGNSVATVESASGISPFEPAPINLVPGGPEDLQPGQALTAETFAVLNLAESQGSEFDFELTASGVDPSNGRACEGVAQYTIRID